MIEFKRYKKVARTRARILTAQDYEERQGVVHAPEGILKFTPGDYLAKDAKGEWTIWQTTMQHKYSKVSSEDEHGFADYLRTDSSFAAQMPEIFTIDGMRGEVGDYLVINDGSAWPVAREIFEESYKRVNEGMEDSKEEAERHN
jgi:hypothetical protein